MLKWIDRPKHWTRGLQAVDLVKRLARDTDIPPGIRELARGALRVDNGYEDERGKRVEDPHRDRWEDA